MAMAKSAVTVFSIMALFGAAMATTYTVGDKAGWTIQGSPDYEKWAEDKTFKVGDILFNVVGSAASPDGGPAASPEGAAAAAPKSETASSPNASATDASTPTASEAGGVAPTAPTSSGSSSTKYNAGLVSAVLSVAAAFAF
ncbi:hypothetical protein Patl1_19803 [Pistacia atlantica]|uniref:Uncharacterized protein n=1 Tax=Pistacia atlantica TaxID=434234 RepID=A0ACC1BNQ5_9ROSI|nr:hypothetical protein Patl1_19803 [Pistacia atlantica]